MAVTFPGGLTIGTAYWYHGSSSIASDMNHVLALTGRSIGFVVRAPRSGTLHGFKFSAGAYWAPGYTFRASFYSVDAATGLPDAELAWGNFFGVSVGDWVEVVEDMTDEGSGLLAHVAGGEYHEVTVGDLIACVITPVTGNATMRVLLGNSSVAFPYAVEMLSGSWDRELSALKPMLVLRYVDDVSAITGVYTRESLARPHGTLAHRAERFFSDPDRYVAAGNSTSASFTLEFDAEVSGVQVFLNAILSGVAGAGTIELLEGDTVLGSDTIQGIHTSWNERGYYHAYWPTVTLTAGVEYTLRLTCTSEALAFYESLDGEDNLTWLPGLRAHLIAVPQSAAAPEVAFKPALCGNAITRDGCVTAVPDDPAIEADTPGTPGTVRALAAPADCGERALTYNHAGSAVPDDPVIVADTPDQVADAIGFVSVSILFSLHSPLVGALTRPAACSPFAPAYCDAPAA